MTLSKLYQLERYFFAKRTTLYPVLGAATCRKKHRIVHLALYAEAAKMTMKSLNQNDVVPIS